MTTQHQEICECAYCGHDVDAAHGDDAPPAATNNAAWREIGEQHDANCEWVVTRAHVLDRLVRS